MDLFLQVRDLPPEIADHPAVMMENLELSFHPLTPKLWRDFEILFGENGACGGCWCMHWKLRGKAFSENKGERNRQMQKSVVDAKTIPGLVAYLDGYPVGWVAIEPRSQYPKLAHSRILKPIDEQEVWSITCLFVEKKHRRKGIAVALIKPQWNMPKAAVRKLSKATLPTQKRMLRLPSFSQGRHQRLKQPALLKPPAVPQQDPSIDLLFNEFSASFKIADLS